MSEWWKKAVVYQIYPRSFMDSNEDGIGDLRGIEGKLDYLKELGIDVIWLSPVYKSPGIDNGYDISDYRDIQDEFGSLRDMEQLISKIHEKGMKILMDLVVNHTSDQHPWFIESRSSKDNPKRDYYIWRDPNPDGSAPNNWESHFSGSAWQFDEKTGQYYLHIFAKEQPDLNWENPEVRKEVKDIARFWLEKGVDGFRMDVINFISKVPGLPSVPNAKGLVRGNMFYMNGPRVHEYLHELNEDVFSKYDIMTVGETPNVTPEIAHQYVDKERGELSMVFQFEHINTDIKGTRWQLKPWTISEFKKVISKWQKALGDSGWNSVYLSNHDQPRSVSRYGNDTKYLQESAKMLCTMDMTIRGTPYVYQGEELGMTNVRFDDIASYQDVESLGMYNDYKAKGIPEHDIMELIYYRGRDSARTPMQWDSSANAGFSKARPWLKLNPNYTWLNAAEEVKNPDSIFNFYKKMIAFRHEHSAIVDGDFKEYFEDHDRIFAYERTDANERLFILLNFSASEFTFIMPEELKVNSMRLAISNIGRKELGGNIIKIYPYESFVLVAEK